MKYKASSFLKIPRCTTTLQDVTTLVCVYSVTGIPKRTFVQRKYLEISVCTPTIEIYTLCLNSKLVHFVMCVCLYTVIIQRMYRNSTQINWFIMICLVLTVTFIHMCVVLVVYQRKKSDVTKRTRQRRNGNNAQVYMKSKMYMNEC